jgi:hypothetical protein
MSQSDGITRRIMNELAECHYSERLSILQSMADSVESDAERVTVLCWLTKELVTEVKRLRAVVNSISSPRRPPGLNL